MDSIASERGVHLCVVLPCNVFFAPYYRRYEALLSRKGIRFDLLVWDRAQVAEESKADKVFRFSLKDTSNNGNPLKVYKFVLFNSFVKRTIKNNKYDKVVFLGSFAANGLLIERFLEREYKQKYWYDIRDYTYEWFAPYYRLLSKVIMNAAQVSISSPGYLRFLPKGEYLIAHNIDYENIDVTRELRIPKEDKISISFIGNVRYYDQNQRLMDSFANDERFLLKYYGMGSEPLQNYAEERGIHNVLFMGRFGPEETKRLYRETDIVNNVYGSEDIARQTALSNKFYFSVANNLPILVSKGTLMDELLDKLGLSYAVSDIDEDFGSLPDRVYSWYSSSCSAVYAAKVSLEWQRILAEDQHFESAFLRFAAHNFQN